MPGIAGIISYGTADKCERLTTAMVRSMEHEPFYTSGTYFVRELGVYAGWTAHEDSFAADQIFLNEQGDIALIFSGECFVDQEVRSALKRKGHALEETNNWLVHLYEEEGEQFVDNLNGLFSGLLIDYRQKRAVLFNDRYGSERIYWHQNEDGTYFASEAKALLRVLPHLKEFDNQGVAQFLSFGCPVGERTLFRDIHMLSGGSLWSFENGSCSRRRYFSPETWESQAVLSAGAFIAKLEETFKRALPRYFESQTKIGISLTGGLDSRMIVACRSDTAPEVVCYTFSGETGETFDDRLAAQVAKRCGLEHRLLRIGPDFFSDFASHLDRTVHVTDGCFGATGTHETYFNHKARQVAPVRVTGNYGSELLRGTSTFKPIGLSKGLLNPEFWRSVNCAAESLIDRRVNPITFAVFREIPWKLFGSLAAARSQVTVRTPYLENELVALAYQMPETLLKSPRPAWDLINANRKSLGQIPTDRRPQPGTSRVTAILQRFFFEATFKVDYLTNEGWPNWLSHFHSLFTRSASVLGLAGLHKYLHYRSWFRRELASYVQQAITEAANRHTPFWDCDFLRRMVRDHVSGRKNYVHEINAVLTLQAVERLLLRGFCDRAEWNTQRIIRPVGNTPAAETAIHQLS